MNYMIHYSCLSHVGRCRSMNQDNFICDGKFMDADHELFAVPLSGSISGSSSPLIGVFDGMGGEECGEIASLIAARTASAFTVGKAPVEDLRNFCKEANEKICTYAEENGISAMGTTAALLAFTGREIALCNIGDSKIFRYADQKIEQISVDHYAVAAHGLKPPLSQNLGIPASEMIIDPYVARGQYNDGDVYLLCSDGLTDMVATEDIAKILQETAFYEAANKLLKSALDAGGKDNITIILCKIESEKRHLLSKLFRSKKNRGEMNHGN